MASGGKQNKQKIGFNRLSIAPAVGNGKSNSQRLECDPFKHRKYLFVLPYYLCCWKVFASIDAKSSIWQAAESVPLATRKSIIPSPADCFNLQRALIGSSSPFSHPAYRPLQILHCHAISRRGSWFATTTTSSTDLNLEGGGGGRGSNVLSVKHEGPLCTCLDGENAQRNANQYSPMPMVSNSANVDITFGLLSSHPSFVFVSGEFCVLTMQVTCYAWTLPI